MNLNMVEGSNEAWAVGLPALPFDLGLVWPMLCATVFQKLLLFT